jgi:signal transduction histidine kinase
MEDILEKIYKSGLRLLEPLELEETYKTIVDEAVRLVGAEYGSIAFKNGSDFQRVYSSSPIAYKSPIRKRAYVYEAFTKQKPLIVHASKTSKAHPELKELGIQSTIHIPLSYRGRAVGVLIINSPKNQKFGKKELDILKIFGSFASLAIRKNQLYNEARTSLEVKDKFIQLASHELRTPLTSISGYIQLLHSRLSEHTGVEGKWIKELLFESRRMTNLVAEIVEINRLNAGRAQFKLEELNLGDIVLEALNKFKSIYPHKKIKYSNSSKIPEKVIGDKEKLLLVVNQLLDNATKFSPSDSEVEVILESSKKYNSLSIRDYGEGISKDHLEKIFEGFYKGEHVHKSGMGLGLYLTKMIIDGHKGDLKINSKLQKGTKITISLPKPSL